MDQNKSENHDELVFMIGNLMSNLIISSKRDIIIGIEN